MSLLSEKLSYFVHRQKLPVAELARRCRIERSTLYQYLTGRRPLQNRAQLDVLMRELRLTPDQRTEVLQAYEIARIGTHSYNQRRKIREILSSLLTIEEAPDPLPLESPAAALEVEERKLIQGELEVNRLINQVIQTAAARGETLKLLAQPNYDLLMESLILSNRQFPRAKVIQILCMETDGGPDGCQNLEYVRRILRCGIGIRQYEPRYYYGKATEHYGKMNVLPYLVVTGRYAIQISSDRKTALLQDDPKIVDYLGGFFDRMYRYSFPLMTSIDGFGGKQARWGMDYLESMDFSHTLELCSGLCSVQFWDERLIRTYMNPLTPQYETMVEEYVAYTQALYQVKRRGGVTVLMNIAFVQEFIRTGIFQEYPSVFFAKPVSPADRRLLIQRILQGVEEGWYHIRLVPPEDFPLHYRWEVMIHRGSSLLLQYSSQNQFRLFQFQEADILNAMYDYLESLAEQENVLNDNQSAVLLKQWMEQYLKE